MPVETLEKPASDPLPASPAPSTEPASAAASIPAAPTAPAKVKGAERLVSLDAYRGFTMILMASAGLYLSTVARKPEFKDSALWQFLGYHTDHVAWTGCALWDLIQPAFMFMVGVSLPYSIAARQSKGDSFLNLLLHTLWRSALLVLLAVYLSSPADSKAPSTNWIFTNVLAQIGLGYPLLFLIAWLAPRWQLASAVAILFLYWLWFALTPLPPADYNFAAVGVKGDWSYLTGFAAHWQKNANAAFYFDQWFLNLFPRNAPWQFSGGGYQTLNFVPSLATMIFGLLAGGLLKSERTQMEKVKWLIGAGIAGLALGAILDITGICPSVKRIWTPSWALFSSGWTLLFLAAWYFVIDVKGYKAWAFPCVVVGMNSIAMYVLAQQFKPYVTSNAKMLFGQNIFNAFGETYSVILQASFFLLILWLICFWMYRRKLFLKI